MPGRLVESFDWGRLDFELESLPKMPANSRGVFAAKESDTSRQDGLPVPFSAAKVLALSDACPLPY